MQGVRLLAPNVKGAITNTSLLAALRAQKKPINIEGFLNGAPASKGPVAFCVGTSCRTTSSPSTPGQAVSWGKNLPPIDLIKALGFVR